MPITASLLVAGMALAGASAQAPAPAEAPRPPDRPLTGIVSNLRHDITRLPSTTTAIVLGVGVAGALATHPSDRAVSDWTEGRPAASYTTFGRLTGDGWTQAGVAVGTYALGLAVRHQPTTHLGADLIRGQVLTGLFTHGLKVSVNRRRPSGGVHSFPSGHTSSAFLTAAVIDGHYGWRAGLPAYGLAAFIGWTRVRDDAHWLTDVIVGGTAIGTIVGRTVTAGHRPREWTVNVAPTAGGFAVAVVKTDRANRSARRSD